MTIPGSRILIEPTEPIRQLPSGLYLPEIALQKPKTGTIVVVGTTADKELLGRTIMYNPVTAVEIEKKHLIHVTDIRFIL